MTDRVLLRASTSLSTPPQFMRTGELAMDPAGRLYVGVANAGVPVTAQPPTSVVLSGAPTTPTPPPGDASLAVANTQFVAALFGTIIPPPPSGAVPAMDGVAAAGNALAYARGNHVHPTDTSRAPLDSPAFINTPTAPTQSFGTNDQTLANTAFVARAIANVPTGGGAGTPAPQATNSALGIVRGGGTGNITVNVDGSLQAPATPGPPGPPGSLAAGSDISSAMVATLFGGKAQLLSAFLGDTRTSRHYGTQNSTQTAQSLLGVNTRADLYNYTNGSGNYPFAFMRDYPCSSGDDQLVFTPGAGLAPTNQYPGTTLTLAANMSLPSAQNGYTGPTGLYTCVAGYSWLYTGDANPNAGTLATFGQPVADTGGVLAAGTTVLATQDNCVRITNQPAGTTLAAGAVVIFGTRPVASMVGKQVFCPQGLKAPRNRTNPFPTITAINAAAGTVTLSAPLYVSTQYYVSGGNTYWSDGDSYSRKINGVFPLAAMYIFTPLPESTIAVTITMDTLSFLAAVFNSRRGDQSHDVTYLCQGDHYLNLPIYLWDVSTSIVGAGSNATVLRTRSSSYAVISYFPTQTAKLRVGGFAFLTSDSSKSQYAGLYIEGASETLPLLNNISDIQVTADVFDVQSQGPVQGVKLRHLGGVLAENLTSIGKGLTTLNDSTTLAVQNTVYIRTSRVGGAEAGSAIRWEGYGEHWIVDNMADVSCACMADTDLVSTVNQVGILIVQVQGTDMDVQFFGMRLCHVQSLVMGFQEIQFPNAPLAMLPGRATAPIVSLEGGDGGTVAHCFGGAASPGNTDAFQLKPRNMNGAPKGQTGLRFSELGFGLAATLRVDAMCNLNNMDDNSITGTIIDNGVNTRGDKYYKKQAFFQAVPASGSVLAAVGAAQVIPVIVAGGAFYDDNGNYNQAGNYYVCPFDGKYRVTIRLPVLPGTAAGAPPDGTSMGVGCDVVLSTNFTNWQAQNPGNTGLLDVRELPLPKGTRIYPGVFVGAATSIYGNGGEIVIEWVGSL